MASSPRSPIPASRESVSLALFMQATGIFLLYLLGTTHSRLQSWVFEKPRFEVVLEDLFQQREERKMSLDVISGKHHPRGFHTYFFHDVVEEIHVVRRWRIYGDEDMTSRYKQMRDISFYSYSRSRMYIIKSIISKILYHFIS